MIVALMIAGVLCLLGGGYFFHVSDSTSAQAGRPIILVLIGAALIIFAFGGLLL